MRGFFDGMWWNGKGKPGNTRNTLKGKAEPAGTREAGLWINELPLPWTFPPVAEWREYGRAGWIKGVVGVMSMGKRGNHGIHGIRGSGKGG